MISLPVYKVVIDTNVFISAILYGGLPDKVVALIGKKQAQLLISPDAERELLRKAIDLHASKPFQQKLVSIIQLGEKIIPVTKVKKSRDPKDDMLLALAFAGRADFLITGDKDLLVLGHFAGTKILSPRQFLTKTKLA